MKQYFLKKIQLYDIEVEKIIYDFKVNQTNTPTRFINIIIHQTGNKKSIQEIIDLHVKKNHWSAIGYHFIISQTGKIYYSRELKYAGAHTYSYNKNSIGIALLGNYNKIKPTEKQIISLKKLISKLKINHPIKRILGHNQAIYKLIRDKFWKLNLDDINPIEIQTKLSYDIFTKEITTKILEFNASPENLNLIKKFKSCPGFNMYKILNEIEKEF